jgi:2'-5' RNA ligase
MEEYSGHSFLMSAIVLPVREIEPVAQPYRRKYTDDGALGLLPHVTILYPFVAQTEWNPDVRQALESCLSTFSSFKFELMGVNRFASQRVLFLDPVPKEVILDLTRIVAETFPDYPLYEGKIPFEEHHPHVTIAIASTNQAFIEIEKSFNREISSRLPMLITVDEVWFIVKADNRWQCHTKIKLGEEKGKII